MTYVYCAFISTFYYDLTLTSSILLFLLESWQEEDWSMQSSRLWVMIDSGRKISPHHRSNDVMLFSLSEQGFDGLIDIMEAEEGES